MADRSFDMIVIGAGIVGLATALEATRRFPGVRLAVLEKEAHVAAHQTGHNSGVIHSGLYYRPGSQKAKLCVEGATLMVRFCREHSLPYNVCGKVVVATSDAEIPALDELHRRGTANGVPGLEMIGPERLREIEPQAAGVRALWVPTTGITDFAAVARKYVELIEAAGGKVLVAVEVMGIRRAEETVVETRAGAFRAKTVVNCAGLMGDN
jgi:(S)-2-hydroxyglutarate dehydrogenase